MRCWYARWQLSNALDRGEVAARGHVARCAACAAHARALDALDARLRGGAARAPAPRPVSVERPRRWWLVAAPLAASLATLVIALSLRAPDPSPPPAAASAAPSQLAGARAVAGRVTRALIAERSPLEVELAALVDEGRRGLDVALLGLSAR